MFDRWHLRRPAVVLISILMFFRMPNEAPNEATAGGDPRCFSFAISCCHCRFDCHTLQQGRKHFVYQCPHRSTTKIRCGCCTSIFHTWGSLVSHLNVRGAHLRQECQVTVISSSSNSDLKTCLLYTSDAADE